MALDTKVVTEGRTGDPIPHSGVYAAAGCCRMTKALKQGDLFPACPAHGKCTWWEPVPASAAGNTFGVGPHFTLK
jgi:hypothetical protein